MPIGYQHDGVQPLPDRSVKGRGSISNRTGRYEPLTRDRVDDGWTHDIDHIVGRRRTTLGIDAARKVITRNDSPDVPFDRSINPYRGCEHGCVYCFARPTHAYLGLSPGLDFEIRLLWKPNAAELLRAELAKPSYRCKPIAFGTNTDPYQPIERQKEATRSLLAVLTGCRHPFTIVTKNALVCRDLDLIAPAARENRARVALSVTTLDQGLASVMEPRASAIGKRIETVRRLSDAGVHTSVLVAPIVPAINDQEIETILEQVAEAGAASAGYVLLRLPLEIKDLFREWLEAHFPDRAERVLSLIRQSCGGALYQAEFGRRMRGSGAYADLIANRFRLALKRFGLNPRNQNMDCSSFRPPQLETPQMELF